MVKVIQKDKEKMVFSVEMSESLANAIRRSVLEVPTLAIDEVEIYKNDSALYDEIIAHRLGLVPLKMEKDLNLKSECSCEGKGCGKCTVELKMQTNGPGIVYSKELKGKAEVVYGGMPITLLREDQEIELVATAILGKGTEHAKFSPGLVYYRSMADIDTKNCSACEECVNACPRGLLQLEGKKVSVKDEWKCDMCDACVEACKEKGDESLKVNPSKEIIYFIESFGQMDPKDILIEAVKALKSNLKIVDKA